MMNQNNVISHAGVSGMRWGYRYHQSYSVAPRNSGKGGQEFGEAAEQSTRVMTKREQKKELKRIKKDRKRAAKNSPLLSDDEIMKQVGRLKKEKELHDLTRENLDYGKSEVHKTLKNTGKKVAATTAVAVGTYTVAVAFSSFEGKKFSPSKFKQNYDPRKIAEYMKPKKK